MPPSHTAPLPTWLSSEDALFILKGLSITVASRDRRHVPSISRGLACRLSPDAKRLIVILVRSQSTALLSDIDSSKQVAVVITEPSTHRTLQLKGHDALVEASDSSDIGVIHNSRANFGTDLLPLGFSAAFTDLLYTFTHNDLCRISFTPTDVYQQTPGQNAGARIGPAP